MSKAVAYGGVVFDSQGRVLLREPKNHFDNYVWTFAKGRPEPNETPAKTALREVEEETGIPCRILAPIPGDFTGGTTQNGYFLMVPIGEGVPIPAHHPETERIRWVQPGSAAGLISETLNPKGRQRDLSVLAAALAAWSGLSQT